MTTHKQIMDEAYKIWEDNQEWTKSDFFNHLNFKQKAAVSLGNLNYQVCNGGFTQWYDNGYAKVHITFLKTLLKEIKTESELRKGLELTIKAYEELKRREKEIEYAENDDCEYGKIEDIYEDYDTVLANLDSQYYDLDNIVEEMDNYISHIA